jgi:5-methylcytosine-specific restriction endonuclease McrA
MNAHPTLFPKEAKSRFLTITGDRYRNMVARLAKKHMAVPFNGRDLREHVLDHMGDRYDGALKCPYCRRVCDISEVEFDHATPLSRGGSPGLDNIEYPCAACNAQKGEMLPWEFVKLLDFLEHALPLARTSILKRLQEHSKLLATKRRSEMLIRNHGVPPAKRPAPGKPPMISAIEEAF